MWSKCSTLLPFGLSIRSVDVDQILPNMIGMVLQLSRTERMTSGCSKTVSNVIIGYLILSYEIKILLDLLPWLSTLDPFPEFDLSKKVILAKAPPKGTCPRKLCEIQGGLKLATTVSAL